MFHRLTRLALVGVLAAGVAACDEPTAPEATELQLAQEVANAPADRGPTIAEIAAGNPDFSTLVAALEAADLVDVLDGRRQFTVFAPTNEAFGRLLDLLGLTAGELLADTELLTSVLLYHVAPGNRDSEDVLGSERIRTLNRGFLFPTVEAGTPFIVDGSAATADAPILIPDIEASNGVVHVIGEVLVP